MTTIEIHHQDGSRTRYMEPVSLSVAIDVLSPEWPTPRVTLLRPVLPLYRVPSAELAIGGAR